MNGFFQWLSQLFNNLISLVRMPYDLSDALGMITVARPSLQSLMLLLLCITLVISIIRTLGGGRGPSVIGCALRAVIAFFLIGLPTIGSFAGYDGLWYMFISWIGWTLNPHIAALALSRMAGLAIILCYVVGLLGFACLPGASGGRRSSRDNSNTNFRG